MSRHDEQGHADAPRRPTAPSELALLFLKLGAVAFGGPAAHIAMMEDEVVRRRGWPGLVVAGSCFILPAALIVTAFAWAYVRYGSLPQTERVLYGVKPVIIAVVLQALWGLGKTAVKTRLDRKR